MPNFQSKTNELINTATVAGVLYKNTPEQQFKEMRGVAKRLRPEKENETKLQRSIDRADIAGQVYGVQWTRNKIAQERIVKLLNRQDNKLIDKADPELDGEKYRSFVNLVSQRNRVASQFGLSPVDVNDYIYKAYEDAIRQDLEAQLANYEEARKPYHIQTKTDDKGNIVYKTVSELRQLDWNMDMVLHGRDRYQGKQADAMRAVLIRRFAKMPNPMTAAQFKGGPEW